MIKEILGIIIIIIGIFFLIKNKEDIFTDLRFNIFNINRILILISLILMIFGIILILW